MRIERRFSKGVEARASIAPATGVPQIEGYAAVFNEFYETDFRDLGILLRETIKPGAFTEVMGADVRCLFNHQPDNVLGRSTNGTLSFTQDATGLAYVNQMDPETNMGKDVYRYVKRGDVTGCSFAFTVGADTWTDEEAADGTWVVTRTIERIDGLYDVGPVTYPAYEQTSVVARAELRASGLFDSMPEGLRTRIEAGQRPQAAEVEPRDMSAFQRYTDLLKEI